MDAGAAGFLLKDAPASELASAIRRAAAGGRLVDPDLAIAALSEGSNPLTEREREVLAASVEAATIPDIAGPCRLSDRREPPLRGDPEGGARNRGEAARMALERGWIGPGAKG